MKVLVLSDVHGNLPALEYIINQEKDADLIISLGDIVNYGPWSNECVDLCDSLNNKILLKGNHEVYFIQGFYEGKNEIAQAFFNFCYPGFERKETIKQYEESYSSMGFLFTHTLGDQYIFPDTEVHLKGNTFIGHSHRQFSKKVNGYQLINTGSAGQNRLNIDILNYARWYPESGEFELVEKLHNADLLLKEMVLQKYPQKCIEYIKSKRAV